MQGGNAPVFGKEERLRLNVMACLVRHVKHNEHNNPVSLMTRNANSLYNVAFLDYWSAILTVSRGPCKTPSLWCPHRHIDNDIYFTIVCHNYD